VKLGVFLLGLAVALAVGGGWAVAESALVPPDQASFALVYEELAEPLRDSAFGVPLLVDAEVSDAGVQGEVYSVLDHSFEAVSVALTRPDAWCDMLTLHFNVKSCAIDRALGGTSERVPLTIATARKYYVPPRSRTAKTYWLDASGSSPDLLRAVLTGDQGPFGIRDMRIEVFGMEAGPGESFVHLRYAYAPGWLARAATRAFLATLGRSKVGFTVLSHDAAGEPVYVRGPVGAVERNAMRYYLGIVAYLDTLAGRASDRFERRIARWFELTEAYPRQLREMPRDEYLQMKRRERADDALAGPN
jgi:hypothetical protein